jgi:hypothetical protein
MQSGSSNLSAQAVASARLPWWTVLALCGVLLSLTGCSRGTKKADLESSETGGGEAPAEISALPGLLPPDLDVERALELFQSIGGKQAPLEVPPPPQDLAAAVVEVEPNDRKEEATPLGAELLARGTAEKGTYDYFRFEIEGPPRRWFIEVRGTAVGRAEYSDSGGTRHRLGKRGNEEGVLVAANLVLQPGQHWIHVYGSGKGEYTVRLAETGSATAGDDREPNDDATRAEVIRVGDSVSGLFFPDDDHDHYRFSLFSETKIQIRLHPPPDARAWLNITDSNGNHRTRVVRWQAAEDGAAFEEIRSMLPGDYLVAVGVAKGSSREPYTLSVEPLAPGSVVVDLEPNDGVDGARSLPDDGILEGTLAGSDDFYRLPAMAGDTKVRMAGPVVETTAAPGAEPLAPGRLTPRNVRILPYAGEKKFVRVKENPETGLLEVDLPAGSEPILQLGGSGPYRLEVTFDPPLPDASESRAPMPSVDLRLSAANHRFAAFFDRFQETRIQAALANRGDQSIDVELNLSSDHYAWAPRLASTTLTLPPGETRVVDGTLEVSPDAWSTYPVRLTLEASVDDAVLAGDSLLLYAECGAPPVAPSDKGLLPPALEGGFNVAGQILGGRLKVEDERAYSRVAAANNGFTFIDEGPAFPLEDGVGDLTVELSGSQSVPVAGVLLNPQSSRAGAQWVRDFDLLLSEDGVSYARVLSGTLQRLPLEQHFALDAPIPARFARLLVRSTWGAGEKWATVGELKVVAAPGWDVSGGSGFNLAAPDLGGHVVRWSWRVHYYSHAGSMLTEEAHNQTVRVESDLPTEWVVGFHHGRAALIGRLEWIDKEKRRYPAFERVQVSVSTESPLGPWHPVGTWDLFGDRSLPRVWDLDQPVWARFVRFSNFDAEETGFWELPQTVRIWEEPTGAEYRSILTEWGHYSPSAFYEARQGKLPMRAGGPAVDDNDTRQSAESLSFNETVAGVVTLGEDEDWYRVEMPSNENTLDLEITGDPRLKAIVELYDESGNRLEWGDETALSGLARMSALPGPGRTVYVRVYEPHRSIAFAWDNSGSVGSYLNTIYPAIARFTSEVRPGLEFANLHPFGGTLLLGDWSDDPDELRYAVQNYNRKDNSSSAEPALGLIADELAERQGTRAVVLLTDAKTPSTSRSVEMWSSLERSRPSVFALHLHTSREAHPQRLMQDWASANGGLYEYFRTQGDLDAGFQRAACHIRRPAGYELIARTRYEEPPGPGFLTVEVPETRPDYAVELILDASGSMLQRIGAKTRIAIARDVLTSLVNETIPAGTPVALRVFGHRKPDACDTELVAPLAPLDRGRISAIIRSTEAKNLAKTPIGESLSLVAQDLSGASGPKLVILITDGEETCDGDPAGAIRELKEAGIGARLNVVGFAIDDAALKRKFESWARVGGGLYFDTADEEELGGALDAALRPKFQVLDAGGEIVAEGTARGEPVAIPMGLYDVKVLTSPVRIIRGVRIDPEKTVSVSAGGGG